MPTDPNQRTYPHTSSHHSREPTCVTPLKVRKPLRSAATPHTNMAPATTSPFQKELFIAVLENVNISGMNEGICHEIVSTATSTQPTRTSISSKTTSNLWIAFDTRRERDAALLINWADHFTPHSGSHIFSREGRRHSAPHDSQTSQVLELVHFLSSQVSQLTKTVEIRYCVRFTEFC